MTAPAPRLLMLVSAPARELPDGEILFDPKFLSGMDLHKRHWPGEIVCVMPRTDAPITLGERRQRGDLPFGVVLEDDVARLGRDFVAGFDILLAAADVSPGLDIGALVDRSRTKCVYTIEYVIRTRLQIAALDKTRSLPRKLWSMLWLLRQERRRRRAFRAADGLQSNGYPAAEDYGRLVPRTMIYIDSRMHAALFATEGEMQARAARLASGAPLRLVYSGRFETMKGVQDLVPVAAALRRRGLDFTLDLYGSGSLRPALDAAIADAGLGAHVRLFDPVPFETDLVPRVRNDYDLFLACHRQSDPSCTYTETMGCGVPIVGYDNRSWSALQRDSGGGWTVRMGDVAGMADRILAVDRDRQELAARAAAGLAFAKAHDFDTEFRRRMDFLAELAAS